MDRIVQEGGELPPELPELPEKREGNEVASVDGDTHGAPETCYHADWDGSPPPISIKHPAAPLANAIAGASAGAIAATMVCPLDVIKTRMQCQAYVAGDSIKYNGVYNALATVAREEGVRGMYRGLGPTMMALLPNWAVYFTVYEGLKHFLEPASSDARETKKRSTAVHISAAVGAGAATVFTTNPLWVVKTRLQVDASGLGEGLGVVRLPYKNTLDGLKRMVREEGTRGMYSGLGPALLGVSHVAIQFPVYEHMKGWLAEREGKSMADLSVMELIAASVVSKITASTATYPHEVVRARMQMQGLGPFKGSLSTVKQLYAEGKVHALYRGCGTNLIRTTPAAAITLLSFELINRSIEKILPS